MITTELEAFHVIGIFVRTTNTDNKSLQDIGDLFQEFIGNTIFDKIPNRISEDIYCVYTDYESDFNGPYTTMVGCKVSSLTDIPTGLVGKTIPAAKYQIYTSTGRLSVSLAKTWEGIWRADVDRRYSADFDVYGEKARDYENAEVDTYVAIN
jgi:predicted transcriptional regulator YdeE